MASTHLRRVAALAVALALALGACSGGPGGGGNDPAGAVTNALNAANGGGVAKLTEYACAAKKGDIAAAFGGTDMSALEAAGVKADELMNAVTFTFANVKTTEVSKTDTAAKVHVTADMTVTFDREKMKTIFKTVLTSQGLPADDSTVEAALGAMGAQLSQTQKLDEDVDVVNEGGKWLICS